ncbi:aminoglycoside phosphotransferase family protein [Leptothoe spongobia]|uniref:Aminoglycoside phosphotransferase family protein n=1 Tax=Leptothoe spongobia TAU-MAC 1115 TaxID=1967444 RepID=A0A947GKB0_9CYAN|nr:aminoglycoside phosphotransferase family protein [Leptothoe spongobia]MBT9316197.1 aminoglycoside phosphotransferase family protein [Leptothoe spongobia TAU-MAC 1115]
MSVISHNSAVPIDWITNALPSKLGTIQQVETVKQRPWSQVYQIKTEYGIAYFKICGLDHWQEVSLLRWLMPQAIMPDVFALDIEQGWILIADGGILLRELPNLKAQDSNLATLLSNYARLQQRSLEHIGELLAMPLPNRRLGQIPYLVQQLLNTGTRQGWLDKELSKQVLDTLPTLEQLGSKLSGTPYATALDHGDLHTGNILFKQNQLHICDWGDACITHPFCSLLPLVETVMGSQYSTLAFSKIVNTDWVNAYLQAWNTFAPMETLQMESQQALCIALLLRALNIAYAIQHADVATLTRWSHSVTNYLSQWVQVEPLVS